MAGSPSRRSRPRPRPHPVVASFSHPVKVTVHRPELALAPSLAHLDVEALARASRAEIDVGYIQGDDGACCRRQVRAVVRRGMVTDFLVDACDDRDAVSPTPELARLMRLAQQRIARQRTARRADRAPELPIPVREFVPQAAALTIKVLVCIQICVLGFCITCCRRTDLNGDIVCGRVIIDTTVPS